MNIGDRVRVKQAVMVYTHPEYRNQAKDVQGFEGEIEHIISDYKGRPVSPDLPYRVKFTPRFKAHFKLEELEAL
ncbi:ferredoxin-thioredoxin reductase variable chain [Candidatus Cyanaurora vandensis]|uniref:ferredoxin-thioredoxin reductase variable chain n=1 Tax=Candidatus Cyanaurora vandensis TaxID=2714958 RepID=UPI00257C9400|nr:ferredoxin-thioredoxin reductase variable chain [Candidatus Cyanaurora vandensis]